MKKEYIKPAIEVECIQPTFFICTSDRQMTEVEDNFEDDDDDFVWGGGGTTPVR